MTRALAVASALFVLGVACAKSRDAESVTYAESAKRANDDAALRSAPRLPLAEAGAPDASSSGSTADVDAGPSDCDVIIEAARREAFGLVKVDGALRDPVCMWRFEDAQREVAGDLVMRTRGTPTGAGDAGEPLKVPRFEHAVMIGASGRRPFESVRPKLRIAEAAVQKCARGVAAVGPELRVLFRVIPAGKADIVLADYRLELPAATRDCVTTALGALSFPRDANPDPTTFTVIFPIMK